MSLHLVSWLFAPLLAAENVVGLKNKNPRNISTSTQGFGVQAKI
jgi:hypothetical protein